jgi:hypothetical protein
MQPPDVHHPPRQRNIKLVLLKGLGQRRGLDLCLARRQGRLERPLNLVGGLPNDGFFLFGQFAKLGKDLHQR